MKSKARIVRVGKSRGIRIPKALLEEAGLAEDVELDAVTPTHFDTNEWKWE